MHSDIFGPSEAENDEYDYWNEEWEDEFDDKKRKDK